MSRQPSPGPSHFPPSAQHANNRQKSKNYTQGIAAGAEDAKYKTKYRELKKKVREIEMDNDKLHIKILQSRKNIQRLRLERAILYERLSSRQPFPNAHPTPPAHSYPPPHAQSYGHHPSREAVEQNVAVVDASDPAAIEWYRSRGIPFRVVTGSDGQPVQVTDIPSGPPSTPGSHTPTSVPSRYPSGHRDSRQQAPPPMPPAQHLEPSHTSYDRHQSSHNSYTYPPTTPSHFRSHSRGAHPSAPLQTLASGYSHPQQVPPETVSPTYRDYPPGYHTSERERRSHRSNVYEPSPSRLQPPTQPLPVSHSPSRSPASSRGSNQVHNHQRLGPGVSNYGPPEREQDRELRDRDRDQEWERERGYRPREWEREREREGGSDIVQRGGTPPAYASSRSRYAIDDRDGYMSHAREPRGYHHNDVPHRPPSRSLSPRSRSVSPPRRSPRETYYEREVGGMRPQTHGPGSEMDIGRRAPPARSEGELERDIDMEDVRDRAPEPAG
ncbi:hypothetical protein BC827DRAFT_1153272 [Russula dissimulans]|nr:hypothetical protein BC827DRAFT_1153272 [Russula dissimulans]